MCPLRPKNKTEIKDLLDEKDLSPLPFHFIYRALHNALNLFNEMASLEANEQKCSEQLTVLFPHASHFGKFKTLSELSQRLFTGLIDRNVWSTMNCYHLCFLYDCLLDIVEDYSYNDELERRKLFPEMEGQAMDFNQFLLEYFFNTTFLIAPERFNRMNSEERKQLLRSPDFGQDFPELKQFSEPEDPTLGKVINRIPPESGELVLKTLKQNPYTPH